MEWKEGFKKSESSQKNRNERSEMYWQIVYKFYSRLEFSKANETEPRQRVLGVVLKGRDWAGTICIYFQSFYMHQITWQKTFL